jgi:hypothetical protein
MPSPDPNPQRQPPGELPGVREAPRARPRGPREFTDRAGVAWRVDEVSGDVVPAARGPACLVFHSDAAIRRVWRYPANWRQLTDDELTILSWET